MRVIVFICVLVLLAGCLLPGCTKDDALALYGQAVEVLGNVGLTAGPALQGERKFGEDKYTGTYKANYVNFSGEEGLFGGTMLEKRENEHVTVSGAIRCDEGQGKLIWSCGASEPVEVASGEGDFSQTVYLSPGSNYFNFRAEEFTGSLELTIE